MSAATRKERQRAELRAEILATARALVRAHGYEGLTIRQVAKQMGYSPMALYFYFADKQAILVALAQEGFQRLAERLRRRVPAEPLAALRRTMAAYVEFGVENPEEYRLVFMSPEPPDAAPKSERDMAQEEHSAFAMLLRQVGACVEAGVLNGDAFQISTLLWTGMHGVASLLITFPSFPFGERKRFTASMVETLLAGLRVEREPGGRGLQPARPTPRTKSANSRLKRAASS